MNLNRSLNRVLSGLVCASCMAGGALVGRAGPAEEGQTGAQVPRVEVLSAAPATLSRTTTQPATVHAYYRARIFAKASGYVAELQADIGAVVERGDVLGVIEIPELGRERATQMATIRQREAEQRRAASEVAVAQAESAAYQAKHEQARAEVDKAAADVTATHTEMERVTELVRQQAVATRLLDEVRQRHESALAGKSAAEAAVAAAAAQMSLATAKVEAARADSDVAAAMTEVAQRQLDELDELISYSRVTAPFDGVVTERNVEIGDLVSSAKEGGGRAANPLFAVAQLDPVRVRVPVPERDAPYAHVGDSAELTFQALPGRVLHGTVSRIAGELAEQTRTMLVEIDLRNEERTLRPGMFGQAKITLAPPGKSLMLPAAAVRFDEAGNSYVYVVNASGAVEVVNVATGLDDGTRIEITSGLQGSERIVGPQLLRLHAGQKVSVKE